MQLRIWTRALLVALLVSVGHGPALAAGFTVNDTTDRVDANPGDGTCATAAPVVCTLRAAVQEANALAGADVITIPAGAFTLSLTGADDDAAVTGDLDVTAPLTITGNGAAGPNATIVSGADTVRVFDILGSAGNVSISALTVTNGFSGVGQLAGGIWNSATLTLSNVRVLDSEGRLGGGGINNDNTLTATDVTIAGCTTNSQGGGLYNTGSATLTGVTLSGNHSGAIGGRHPERRYDRA
jgi:CSLREA domain-containing protein